MSFVGDEGFLGAAIVKSQFEEPGAATIEAVSLAWEYGINPGGEVASWTLPDGSVHPEDMNRLLTRDEALNLRKIGEET